MRLRLHTWHGFVLSVSNFSWVTNVVFLIKLLTFLRSQVLFWVNVLEISTLALFLLMFPRWIFAGKREIIVLSCFDSPVSVGCGRIDQDAPLSSEILLIELKHLAHSVHFDVHGVHDWDENHHCHPHSSPAHKPPLVLVLVLVLEDIEVLWKNDRVWHSVKTNQEEADDGCVGRSGLRGRVRVLLVVDVQYAACVNRYQQGNSCDLEQSSVISTEGDVEVSTACLWWVTRCWYCSVELRIQKLIHKCCSRYVFHSYVNKWIWQILFLNKVYRLINLLHDNLIYYKHITDAFGN